MEVEGGAGAEAMAVVAAGAAGLVGAELAAVTTGLADALPASFLGELTGLTEDIVTGAGGSGCMTISDRVAFPALTCRAAVVVSG